MTADINIPPAALEAAARAMWKTDDPSQWELGMARAALLAGLKAWPGMRIAPNAAGDMRIILHLSENTND